MLQANRAEEGEPYSLSCLMAMVICCSFTWQEAHTHGCPVSEGQGKGGEARGELALQVRPASTCPWSLILGPLESFSSTSGVSSAQERVGRWGRNTLGAHSRASCTVTTIGRGWDTHGLLQSGTRCAPGVSGAAGEP